jgi:3-methyladenine DNA glycosylase AlkD
MTAERERPAAGKPSGGVPRAGTASAGAPHMDAAGVRGEGGLFVAVLEDLAAVADPAIAAQLQRFFRTGPGEYGEGDRFMGVRVPLVRALARRYAGMSLADCRILLQSEWHEARLLALLVLVRLYHRGAAGTRAAIYELYLQNTDGINSWDLVDVSAEHIVGRHIHGNDTAVLGRLAVSPKLWERRIAILATFHFIRRGEFGETLRIADLLLGDDHDLIHKATGWMLREVGKRNRAILESFLEERYRRMPRTMLRYAIEKLDQARRLQYLHGTV